MQTFDFADLEVKIGYQFKNRALLKQALTHSSYSNEQRINKLPHYERIEFLGDAVLELISSEFYYHTYPDMPEGSMTKHRASAVCEQALAITARQLELGKYMLFGKGEEATGGRDRESIIADAVEALIGAIYLDSGLEKAREFIKRFVLNDLETKALFYDAKSILQEHVQNHKLGVLSYNLVDEQGPEHAKCFFVDAMLDGKCIGKGKGQNKKSAEQDAAYQAIIAQNIRK